MDETLTNDTPATSDRRNDESVRPHAGLRVGLFVTCLVDLFRPNVGFSAVDLLEQAGCEVVVPEAQTCCGQPAFNSGDDASARPIARGLIEAFDDVDYIVAPSGSCAGMLREHYPELFADDPVWQARAEKFAERTFELISFLTDVMGVQSSQATLKASCTYHDSCSGLRELGVQAQPRYLLASVPDLEVREMQDSNVCCGFGGTFCVKYPEISTRMVSDKVRNIEASGADMVLGGDMGCLMNIAGKLSRAGSDVRVYHVAEVLAGRTDVPPVAQDESSRTSIEKDS